VSFEETLFPRDVDVEFRIRLIEVMERDTREVADRAGKPGVDAEPFEGRMRTSWSVGIGRLAIGPGA